MIKGELPLNSMDRKNKPQEIAEKNRILLLQAGSRLYGTDTQESDDDRVAIFMPDIEHVFGFQKCEIIQDGTRDFTQYEFRKFVKLAMECNPNVLELLFCEGNNILFADNFGRDLLAARELFPFRDGIVDRFKGYAFSQKHKMTVKKEHYEDLLIWRERLETHKVTPSFNQKLAEIFDNPGDNEFIKAGDIKLQTNWTIAKCYKIIKSRLDRVGKRTKSQDGPYDTKFAMHLIRLLFEACSFLRYGIIEFPFKGPELRILQQIRAGNWELMEIIDYSESLEKDIDTYSKSTKLPARQRFQEIQAFTISMMKKWMEPKNIGEVKQRESLCSTGRIFLEVKEEIMNYAEIVGLKNLPKVFWSESLHVVHGCTKCAPECKGCWELKLHKRMINNPRVKHRVEGTVENGEWTGQVNLIRDDLEKPGKFRKPQIFAIWTDLFHPEVPFEFIYETLWMIRENPHHVFIICTKRAARMREFFSHFVKPKEGVSRRDCVWFDNRENILGRFDPGYQLFCIENEPWPLKNLWLMVTGGTRKTAEENLRELVETPARVHALIAEPLLEDISPVVEKYTDRLDWLITGGETGKDARPSHPNWFRCLRDLAGNKFLFKGWGEWGWYQGGHPNLKLPRKFVDIGEKDFKAWMVRVGKREAGYKLDRQVYHQFPSPGGAE